MKKLLVFLSILSIVSCNRNPASSDSSGINLSAKITISNWTQDYDQSTQSYSWIRINYIIENIGNVEINSHTVYFKLKCVDGSERSHWDSWLCRTLDTGKPYSYNFFTRPAVLTGPGYLQVTEVTIHDYEIWTDLDS